MQVFLCGGAGCNIDNFLTASINKTAQQFLYRNVHHSASTMSDGVCVVHSHPHFLVWGLVPFLTSGDPANGLGRPMFYRT